MDNRVRITSDENVVTNASIEIRNTEGEWQDVRNAVRGVTVHLRVGEVSHVDLDLILATAQIEAVRFGFAAEVLEQTVAILRACGYTITEPATLEAVADN